MPLSSRRLTLVSAESVWNLSRRSFITAAQFVVILEEAEDGVEGGADAELRSASVSYMHSISRDESED